MSRPARWFLLAAMAVSVAAGPNVASARHHVWSNAVDSTVAGLTGAVPEPTSPPTATDPIAPEPTTPDPAPADSVPATSEPDNSPPESFGDDALVGAGDPDSDVDSTTAAIAVVGSIFVLALAGWWMVRRNNPDAEPMPRDRDRSGPPTDII